MAQFDKGGAVCPIEWCPHVLRILNKEGEGQGSLQHLMNVLPGLNQTNSTPCSRCPGHNNAENWLCLNCGDTLCSRYQEGHSITHFEETKRPAVGAAIKEAAGTDTKAAEGTVVGNYEVEDDCHCVYLSFSDISVWCHACESYIKNERLLPILVHAEAFKFGTAPKLHLLADGPSEPIRKLDIIEEDKEDDVGF